LVLSLNFGQVNNAGVAKEKAHTAYSTQGEPDMKSAEAISEHLLKSTHESWAGSSFPILSMLSVEL
jgi:hypothetical protein